MTDSATSRVQEPAAKPAGLCWSCKVPTGSDHFCAACGKIQPLAPATDYFQFFALPRKLALDPAALERQFHQLSWKLHPDNFHQASTYERELSLETSAVLNDAYRTLRDPVARVEYLLGLEGVRREGEIKQQAPPELLEEVFELNEYLEELRAAKRSGGDVRELSNLRHQLEKARDTFRQKLDQVLAEFETAFRAWDSLLDSNGDAAARSSALEKMSALLNRHSYIRNLVSNVTDELEES